MTRENCRPMLPILLSTTALSADGIGVLAKPEKAGNRRSAWFAAGALALLPAAVFGTGALLMPGQALAQVTCELTGTGDDGGATATGADALACGPDATANGADSVAVGSGATTAAAGTIAVGQDAAATGINSGNAAIAIGRGATSTGGTAVGTAANAGGVATALGSGANATAINSIAIGTRSDFQSTASADAAFAAGNSAAASGVSSIALGRQSTSSAAGAIALGQGAGASGANALALGGASGFGAAGGAQATGASAVALGVRSNAAGTGSLAFGDAAATTAGATNGIAIGTNAATADVGNIAIGQDASVSGSSNGSPALAIGSGATSAGGTAVGAGSTASGTGVALGAGGTATGANSIAIGGRGDFEAVASADGALAVGNSAAASAASAMAIGRQSTSSAGGAVALGQGASASGISSLALGGAPGFGAAGGAAASEDGAVALGSGSLADRAGLAGADELFSGTAVDSAVGAVSVGAVDGERQITNVAGGTTDTDAVNVRQLFAVGDGLAMSLGGGAMFDPATGIFTPPSYLLGDGMGGTMTFDNAGDAFAVLDDRTTANEGQIAALQGGAGMGLVQQPDPAGPITVGAATGGPSVDFAGTDGPRELTGIAAGDAADGSTDAVNGEQLFNTNQGVAGNAAALGGGASFDPDTGTYTAPSYTIQGDDFDTVGDAFTAVDGNLTELENAVAGGEIGLVRQDPDSRDITVAAETDGDEVDFTGTDGTRQLTGVTDGEVSAASEDAINGSQLFGTGTSIASALGGGAAIGPDGTLSAPTYTIGGTAFDDAGSAFGALDGSVGDLQDQLASIGGGMAVNSDLPAAAAGGMESVALGGGSSAGGDNGSALGSGADAGGLGSTALGANSSAGPDGSTAVGSGATATRENQFVLGTGASTYTAPGINSDASRAAQSGPTQFLTTDANGNLASTDLSGFFNDVADLNGRIGGLAHDIERNTDGVAIALALGGVSLPQDKTFAIAANYGNFDGQGALGLGAIGQVRENVYLNAGVGVGFESGTVGGRAGVTFAW